MRKGFSPLSLDAVNFLSADVRGAVGPFLNVFLVTQQHWSQSEVGLVKSELGLVQSAVGSHDRELGLVKATIIEHGGELREIRGSLKRVEDGMVRKVDRDEVEAIVERVVARPRAR